VDVRSMTPLASMVLAAYASVTVAPARAGVTFLPKGVNCEVELWSGPGKPDLAFEEVGEVKVTLPLMPLEDRPSQTTRRTRHYVRRPANSALTRSSASMKSWGTRGIRANRDSGSLSGAVRSSRCFARAGRELAGFKEVEPKTARRS